MYWFKTMDWHSFGLQCLQMQGQVCLYTKALPCLQHMIIVLAACYDQTLTKYRVMENGYITCYLMQTK